MPTGHPGTITPRKRPARLSIRGTVQEIEDIKRRANSTGRGETNTMKLDRFIIAAALGAPIPAARMTRVDKESPRLTLLFEIRQLKGEIDRLKGEIARQGGLLKSLYVRDSETSKLAERDFAQLAEIQAHIRSEEEVAKMLLATLEAIRLAVGGSQD